jgi:hypothetical protein
LHWLPEVPNNALPVKHPADKQALADLLFALEMAAPEPEGATLEAARRVLLEHAGDWVGE